MSPTVDAAFDAATAYFADADVTPANPFGLNKTEYTEARITGWQNTLDVWNNGLAIGGPPHCS